MQNHDMATTKKSSHHKKSATLAMHHKMVESQPVSSIHTQWGTRITGKSCAGCYQSKRRCANGGRNPIERGVQGSQ